MDILSLLKQDHKEVKELFSEAEELGDRATASVRRVFEKINAALTVHARGEEELFYPKLKERAAARSEERKGVLEGYAEHAQVKALLAELEALDPSDETYRPKLKVLKEDVEHHVKEEESEIFKSARELLSKEELEEIGAQMEAMKQRAGLPA